MSSTTMSDPVNNPASNRTYQGRPGRPTQPEPSQQRTARPDAPNLRPILFLQDWAHLTPTHSTTYRVPEMPRPMRPIFSNLLRMRMQILKTEQNHSLRNNSESIGHIGRRISGTH